MTFQRKNDSFFNRMGILDPSFKTKSNLAFVSWILIDAHGLKIQGRWYLMFFAKIPRGGQGFQEKLPGGVPLFRVLLHFY